MKIRNRLVKLERQMGRSFRCPYCQDSPIGQICIYELHADGTKATHKGLCWFQSRIRAIGCN
jgi:hypothetical protein